MARSRASLHVDIWRNPDWLNLSSGAQRLYILILSQPKLSLCGSLDTIAPAKWATMAPDTDAAEIASHLGELEEARFVVLDHDTEELIVRSFTKHDLELTRLSANVVKGLWGHWKGIISRRLRSEVVRNCPDDVWERLEPHAPADAVQTRRSAPFERETPHPFERERPHPIESPASCLQSPVSNRQPPNGDESSSVEPPSNTSGAGGDEVAPTPTPDARMHAAAEVVARNEMRRRSTGTDPVRSPDSWLAREVPRRLERHTALWRQILDEKPNTSAHDLAQAVTNPDAFQADRNTAGTRAAFEAEAQRNAARMNGEACAACQGGGWVEYEDDDGFAGVTQCPDCIAPIEERVRQAMNGDPR